MQRGRTHKIRGAYYKYCLASKAEKEAGYVCASDGNFAQSLSLLAGEFKFKAVMFVP